MLKGFEKYLFIRDVDNFMANKEFKKNNPVAEQKNSAIG